MSEPEQSESPAELMRMATTFGVALVHRAALDWLRLPDDHLAAGALRLAGDGGEDEGGETEEREGAAAHGGASTLATRPGSTQASGKLQMRGIMQESRRGGRRATGA